jgi:hypothetical protein
MKNGLFYSVGQQAVVEYKFAQYNQGWEYNIIIFRNDNLIMGIANADAGQVQRWRISKRVHLCKQLSY